MEEFTLNLAIIAAITIAIVNRIKAELPEIKPIFYTLISIAIGAGLYAVSIYASDVVKGFLYSGLIASGIYDVYKKQ
jgi:hypothetical protein